MGPRRKYVYQDGILRDAIFGEVIRQWNVRGCFPDPGQYRIVLETDEGQITLAEDEEAFWIEQHGERQAISTGLVVLPDFAGHRRAPLLRALHAELLVNLLPWGPMPNLWVYTRPWYRDAAMMALCFERTGNVNLLRPWIGGLLARTITIIKASPKPTTSGRLFISRAWRVRTDIASSR